MVFAHRKGDPEAGAAARSGFMRDDAAVLGDDAVTEGQAEAGAAWLGREEWREEVALGVLGHAGTVVGDGHGKELAAVRPTAHVVAGLDPGGDGELRLKGGARLRVSRTRREALERWLGLAR